MNRRNFLKLCGLAAKTLAFGLGTTACTAYRKDVKWDEISDDEFSIDRFNNWFIEYKLYNDVNPNLKWTHFSGYCPKFIMQIKQLPGPPGINYSCDKMYAVADGYVDRVGERNVGLTATVGGYNLSVAHPGGTELNMYKSKAFRSSYENLDKLYVKLGDKVTRGQLLADVNYNYPIHAKLLFQRRNNWVDPDNYGLNHGYMNYWDGVTDFELNDLHEKMQRQKNIINELTNTLSSVFHINAHASFKREHRSVPRGICLWDDVEIFRYLQELYNARPLVFLNLTQKKFKEMQNKFYANQPIILTLPLKF